MDSSCHRRHHHLTIAHWRRRWIFHRFWMRTARNGKKHSSPSPDIIIVTRSIIILIINPLMKGYCIRAPTAREGAPNILRWVRVEDDDDNAAQQSSIPADGLRPIKSTIFSSRRLHSPALPLRSLFFALALPKLWLWCCLCGTIAVMALGSAADANLFAPALPKLWW